MISFDNGPANGDYVRYIDDLMKRAALAASAGVLSGTDAGGNALDRTRERMTATASPSSRQPTTVVRESRQTTGFAAPVAATPAATAAAAIASALMSGQTTGRAALPVRKQLALIALVAGLAMLLVGLFWAFNIVLIAGSAALIFGAFRALREGSDPAPGTTA